MEYIFKRKRSILCLPFVYEKRNLHGENDNNEVHCMCLALTICISIFYTEYTDTGTYHLHMEKPSCSDKTFSNFTLCERKTYTQRRQCFCLVLIQSFCSENCVYLWHSIWITLFSVHSMAFQLLRALVLPYIAMAKLISVSVFRRALLSFFRLLCSVDLFTRMQDLPKREVFQDKARKSNLCNELTLSFRQQYERRISKKESIEFAWKYFSWLKSSHI